MPIIDKDVIRNRLVKAGYERELTPYNTNWYINCGGHALGLDGWYNFRLDEEQSWTDFHRTGKKGQWKNLERKYVSILLREFPDLKLVNRKLIDDVAIDLSRFEIIAFRICRIPIFCDFHFMRCEPNGDWTEKHGCRKGITRHNYEDIYDIWDGYNGKLFFFVRPRQVHPAS